MVDGLTKKARKISLRELSTAEKQYFSNLAISIEQDDIRNMFAKEAPLFADENISYQTSGASIEKPVPPIAKSIEQNYTRSISAKEVPPFADQNTSHQTSGASTEKPVPLTYEKSKPFPFDKNLKQSVKPYLGRLKSESIFSTSDKSYMEYWNLAEAYLMQTYLAYKDQPQLFNRLDQMIAKLKDYATTIDLTDDLKQKFSNFTTEVTASLIKECLEEGVAIQHQISPDTEVSTTIAGLNSAQDSTSPEHPKALKRKGPSQGERVEKGEKVEKSKLRRKSQEDYKPCIIGGLPMQFFINSEKTALFVKTDKGYDQFADITSYIDGSEIKTDSEKTYTIPKYIEGTVTNPNSEIRYFQVGAKKVEEVADTTEIEFCGNYKKLEREENVQESNTIANSGSLCLSGKKLENTLHCLRVCHVQYKYNDGTKEFFAGSISFEEKDKWNYINSDSESFLAARQALDKRLQPLINAKPSTSPLHSSSQALSPTKSQVATH